MRERHLLHQAYVLHTRPYRNSSLLVELFTFESGRISGVANGVRNQRSPLKGLLQPFTHLLVSYTGRNTQLMTLMQIEAQSRPYCLVAKTLLSGLYLNELLLNVLHYADPHPGLYCAYGETLAALEQQPMRIEKTLRQFEKIVLRELGYEIQFMQEAVTGLPIFAEKFYKFESMHGLIPVSPSIAYGSYLFHGKNILAIGENNYDDPDVLHDAKRLFRMALASLLGKKSLKTRELFVEVRIDE